MTRQEIITAAKSYLGVRFVHQGRNRAGLDCVGLLYCVAKDCGGSPVDFTGYRRIPDMELFRSQMMEQTNPGAINCIQDGTILLLKQVFYPCHCGIVVLSESPTMFIHASIKNRKVMMEPLSQFYRDISYVREFKGVA